MEETDAIRWRNSPNEVVTGVALPLKNLEFLIDEYLLTNGARLDVQTRFLLAGIRDCVGQVASSTHQLGGSES